MSRCSAWITSFGKLVAHRRAPLLFALLAFVLTLPALRIGLLMDDYLQRSVLLGQGEWSDAEPLRDLFALVPAERAMWMRDAGIPPWWSSPDIRIAFARPVTALTHMLDYALWPDSPAFQHLHNLLWYALAVGLAASLYRRLFASVAVAGVAGVLFAVADSHVMAAAWIASRNHLLALVCGLAAMHLHLRFCRERSARSLTLAVLAFALGLGCSEVALATLGYLAAWQLAKEQGPFRRRLLPLVPYVIAVAIWRVVYVGLGFGVDGTTFYLDPGAEPLAFVQAVVERAPLLVAAHLLKFPVDSWWTVTGGAQLALWVLAALLVALLLGLLATLLRRDALARFFALGMAFSLVPMCMVLPSSRMLLFAGVGAFGLIAALFESTGVWPWRKAETSRWRRRVALLLAVVHGPLAAIGICAGAAFLPFALSVDAAFARQAPHGPEVAAQTLVFVNGNALPVSWFRLIPAAMDETPPRRVAQLGLAATGLTVRRTDVRTLVMRTDGGFRAIVFDLVMWDAERRFASGQRIEMPDFTAEIVSVTDDGRPLEVAFRFRTALEDPGLRWLWWKDARVESFVVPGIGASITIPPSSAAPAGR